MVDTPTSLTVPGTFDHVVHIRRWLEQVLQRWQVAEDIIADLKLAVSELCTNIVRHGYAGDHDGDIHVALSRHGGTIQVTINDTAPAFEPGHAAFPPPESLTEGGYGLSLVHSLIDDIAYERRDQGGNHITLIKNESLSDTA